MSNVGQRETRTQQRMIAFFQNVLGYAYLGHWQDRPDNNNVEQALLTDWLCMMPRLQRTALHAAADAERRHERGQHERNRL